MIVSIETEDSSVRVEQYIDDDTNIDEVFNILIEPALLGFGFQKGSILDVCEEYLLDNSTEYVMGMDEEEDEDEEGCSSKDEVKANSYASAYDKGYLAGLKENQAE